MRIIYIRHGFKESKSNVNFNDLKGSKLNLTDFGRQQAAKTGKYLQSLNRKFTCAFSSPYPRCKETAVTAIEQLTQNLEIICDDRLKERILTPYDTSQEESTYNQIKAHTDKEWAPTGGESDNNSAQRFESFMVDIGNKHKDTDRGKDATVLVFGHGRILQNWLSRYMEVPEEYKLQPLLINTCSITQLEFVDGKLRLYELNNTDHLKDVGSSYEEVTD